MRSDYSSRFLTDMGPALADHYAHWFPWCRATTLATVQSLAERNHLSELLGSAMESYPRELLAAAWADPFLNYLQRSGKYIRPYLVCLCVEAYGGNPREWPNLVSLGEVIHSSSLILDDVADDSLFRRGAPTAHQLLGVRVAGAVGSTWLNLGFELVWRDHERLGDATVERLFQELAWEHFVTGLGTTIDVTWAWRQVTDPTPEQYLQEVLHRSTSYTYRLPMKIGGLVGRAPPDEVRKLAAFGEQVGLAFQLIDDILNVASSDEHWGKERAEDVVQGKITLQVILALQRGTPAQQHRLLEILGMRTHDQRLLMEAVDILDSTGALAESQKRAEQLIDGCYQIARSLNVPQVYQQHLIDLAEYVVFRAR